MIHPLQEDTSNLTTNQLEEKISELSMKFFKTTNPEVKRQISLFLDIYKEEVRKRHRDLQNKQNPDLDLDNLIKID